MSILLTEQEVRDLYMNEEGDYHDLARAIQLALIEKMRKEPVGYQVFDGEGNWDYYRTCDGDNDWVIETAKRQTGFYVNWYQPLAAIPIPQELEES